MNNNMDLYKTVSLKPFKHLKPSIRTEAYITLFLLSLQILMLFLTKSYDSLKLLTSTIFASFCNDVIDIKFKKSSSFSWIVALIRGIAIGLLLPSTYPPLAAFLITFFIAVLNRYILGGFANSWINPVAITVAICWLIGMHFFPETSVTLTELQNRNPSLTLIQNGSFHINRFDAIVTSFLNKKVFSIFGVSIPDGYVSLLWDSNSSIPAFRFNFLTLISSIVLFSASLLNPLIPTLYIFIYGALVKSLAPLFYHGTFMQGDVILALLTSGTLFCTFFILSWHGTVPYTNRGKTVFGVSAGIIAFFIVGCGTSPCGTIFTILIINILSLLMQSYENKISEHYAETVLKRKIQSVKDGNHA